jgi:iron uptake system component EfeO
VTLIAAAAVGFATATPATAADAHAVIVKLTPSGCPAKVSVPSGATTFSLTNVGAKNIDEFELLNDKGEVVGEVEALTPGTTGTFVVALDPGTYVTYCPGGARERGKLVVTGAPVPALGPQSQAAVDGYRSYLLDQVGQLVGNTSLLADAVKRGDVAGAKVAYTAARIPYERIEPIAKIFGDLDHRIGATKGEVPASQWTGFHRIEQALWVGGNTNGMGTVATQLVTDVRKLADLVALVKLEPATIANGALALLKEVSASAITGEEERYSHTDLVDIAANVAGARTAFDAIRAVFAPSQPATTATIDQRFDAVQTALAKYGSGGDTYVPYTQLGAADTRSLAQAIDALAEPLSTVGTALVAVRAS